MHWKKWQNKQGLNWIHIICDWRQNNRNSVWIIGKKFERIWPHSQLQLCIFEQTAFEIAVNQMFTIDSNCTAEHEWKRWNGLLEPRIIVDNHELDSLRINSTQDLFDLPIAFDRRRKKLFATTIFTKVAVKSFEKSKLTQGKISKK